MSRFTPNHSERTACTISRSPSGVATTPPWFSSARKTPWFAASSAHASMHSTALRRAPASGKPAGASPAKIRMAGEPRSDAMPSQRFT